jgi:Uma2 family endonuclease
MTPPANVPASQPTTALPNHLQLPQTDGSIVENYQESPQGNLLTSSILPRLRELHPDGQFSIGRDSGIYFRHTIPALAGCRSPDWFYVPDVPPMLDGTFRRSYVLWQEMIRPRVIIEYASGDGSQERDRTPMTGKFWIYERAICAAYYAIFEIESGAIELYRLERSRYVSVPISEAGRLPIPELGVELGVWEGTYRGIETPWLRVWDITTGEMMPSEEERAEVERKRADIAESLADDYREMLSEEAERAEAALKEAAAAKSRETAERRRAETALKEADEAKQRADAAKQQRDEARVRADAAKQRADALAEKLRALGIDPEAA